MQLLDSLGFPVALGLVSIALAIFSAVRVRRDPPVPPASRGTFMPVDQSSPGTIEPAPRAPATPFQAAANPATGDDPAAGATAGTATVASGAAARGPERPDAPRPDAAGSKPLRRAGDATAVEDAQLVAETRQ
jgi:hypothetical protein